MPSYSGVWNLVAQYQAQGAGNWPSPPTTGVIALGNATNILNYITVDTTGNAIDFGDLTVARQGRAGCASKTRGVFAGGDNTAINVIDYITIISPGNATDFGDLTVGRAFLAGVSDSTRGVFIGGLLSTSSSSNVMDYITIASTGNATDFGDISFTPQAGYYGGYYSSGYASPTRGVFNIGRNPWTGAINNIEYITIASTGNSTDFGDLLQAAESTMACSNATRGITAGGNTGSFINVIQYATIASTGNTVDFGDLLNTSCRGAAVSSSTRAVIALGEVATPAPMQYVTISTLGNSITFGDLTGSIGEGAGCSNGHGGL